MPDLQADYGDPNIIRILGWEDNMRYFRDNPEQAESDLTDQHIQDRIDAINDRYWESIEEGEDG